MADKDRESPPIEDFPEPAVWPPPEWADLLAEPSPAYEQEQLLDFQAPELPPGEFEAFMEGQGNPAPLGDEYLENPPEVVEITPEQANELWFTEEEAAGLPAPNELTFSEEEAALSPEDLALLQQGSETIDIEDYVPGSSEKGLDRVGAESIAEPAEAVTDAQADQAYLDARLRKEGMRPEDVVAGRVALEAGRREAGAKTLRKGIDRQKLLMARNQDYLDRVFMGAQQRQARLDADMQAVKDAKVQSFYQRHPIAAIAGVLASGLGGMLAAIQQTGRNPAMEMFAQAVDEDLKLQLAEIDGKKDMVREGFNSLKMFVEMGYTRAEALEASRLAEFQLLDEEIGAVQQEFDPDGTMFQEFREARLQLQMNQVEARLRLEKASHEVAMDEANLEVSRANAATSQYNAKTGRIDAGTRARGQRFDEKKWGEQLQLEYDKLEAEKLKAIEKAAAAGKVKAATILQRQGVSQIRVRRPDGKIQFYIAAGTGESANLPRNVVEGRQALFALLREAIRLREEHGIEWWNKNPSAHDEYLRQGFRALYNQLQITENEADQDAASAGGKLGAIRDPSEAYETIVRDIDIKANAALGARMIPGLEGTIVWPETEALSAANKRAPQVPLTGDPKIDSNAKGLTEADSGEARMWSAKNLGDTGDVRAAPALEHALYDSDALVRVVAASQLAKVGRPESIPHLERVKFFDVKSDKAREVAGQAIDKLRVKYGILDPAEEAARNTQLPPSIEDIDPESVAPVQQEGAEKP